MQKKIRGCNAWEYSRNPVLQKSSGPAGMPVQRGTLQKAWDNLPIQFGSGGVLAQEQFPYLGKDTARWEKPEEVQKERLEV